jgi:hypothetical protein
MSGAAMMGAAPSLSFRAAARVALSRAAASRSASAANWSSKLALS